MTNDIARYCVWNFLRGLYVTWCGKLLGQFHAPTPSTRWVENCDFSNSHSVNSRSEKHYFSRYTLQVPLLLLPCWITENNGRVWNLMIFNYLRLERASHRVRWNDNDKNQHWQFTIKWMIFSCVGCVRSEKMLFQTTSVPRTLNENSKISTWFKNIDSIFGCQRAI